MRRASSKKVWLLQIGFEDVNFMKFLLNEGGKFFMVDLDDF